MEAAEMATVWYRFPIGQPSSVSIHNTTIVDNFKEVLRLKHTQKLKDVDITDMVVKADGKVQRITRRAQR
eukprot:3833881-Amphidinium_carterae.1